MAHGKSRVANNNENYNDATQLFFYIFILYHGALMLCHCINRLQPRERERERERQRERQRERETERERDRGGEGEGESGGREGEEEGAGADPGFF